MENLLINLIAHIAQSVPQISLVDEDYGQLEALDNEMKDMYPLTFPAVLIDAPSCEWNNLSNYKQEGTCTLRIRLVIDCYDDTHYGSNTTDRIMQREEIRKALHKSLQGFRPSINVSELIRTESRFYTYNHGIKVYEATYTCRLEESTRETRLARKGDVSLVVET